MRRRDFFKNVGKTIAAVVAAKVVPVGTKTTAVPVTPKATPMGLVPPLNPRMYASGVSVFITGVSRGDEITEAVNKAARENVQI